MNPNLHILVVSGDEHAIVTPTRAEFHLSGGKHVQIAMGEFIAEQREVMTKFLNRAGIKDAVINVLVTGSKPKPRLSAFACMGVRCDGAGN